MTPERITALIAQFGQPVTLQRVTGTTTQIQHEVVCRAIVRGYEPHELISGSGIVQGDRSVVITNSEIADAQWPAVRMAQNPAALHLDPASRPRPHRPALVATPGASEWVSCVSSPATNRSGRTPEKGVGNLANSPAAFQISLTIW